MRSRRAERWAGGRGVEAVRRRWRGVLGSVFGGGGVSTWNVGREEEEEEVEGGRGEGTHQ